MSSSGYVGNYGYRCNTTHEAIIFERGSHADVSGDRMHLEDTSGLLVGSSEWGWLEPEVGQRICAALQLVHGLTIAQIMNRIQKEANHGR